MHESSPRLNRLVRSYLPFSLPWHLLFGLWEDLEDAEPRMEAWLPANSDPIAWAAIHLLDYLEPLLSTLAKPEAASNFLGVLTEPERVPPQRPRHPRLPDYAEAVRQQQQEPVFPAQLPLPTASVVVVVDAGLNG